MANENIYAELDRLAGQVGTRVEMAADPIGQFCEYWPIIRKVLEWAKRVMPPKIDAAIDAAIRFGDMLCAGR